MSRQSKFVLTLTAVAVFAATGSACAQKLAITNPFGDQVFINPSQALILDTYAHQYNEQEAEFSDKRYAFLLTPGSYNLDVRVGYNTQVIGLGESPDDVTIIGAVRTKINQVLGIMAQAH